MKIHANCRKRGIYAVGGFSDLSFTEGFDESSSQLLFCGLFSLERIALQLQHIDLCGIPPKPSSPGQDIVIVS